MSAAERLSGPTLLRAGGVPLACHWARTAKASRGYERLPGPGCQPSRQPEIDNSQAASWLRQVTFPLRGSSLSPPVAGPGEATSPGSVRPGDGLSVSEGQPNPIGVVLGCLPVQRRRRSLLPHHPPHDGDRHQSWWGRPSMGVCPQVTASPPRAAPRRSAPGGVPRGPAVASRH